MFEISKTFEFSSAHSVHSQRLNPEWAGNSYPKCRRLPGHGHNYRLKVFLSSDKLDESQMVTDFGHLKWLKEFIDDCFDHKLILGMDDPAFHFLLERLGLTNGNSFIIPHGKAKSTIVDEHFRIETKEISEISLKDLNRFNFITFNSYSPNEISPITDFYQRLIDGIAFFKGSPTSENLARFFFKFVSENVKPLGVKCSRVKIYETPTSCASYFEE
ncbi:6-pyruvoyltetrahydropterin/6-carboxytetrahydropterin synthase [Balnearium lithotrophicum]|uniref:6-carboxy-5,6,7,8-tetrahydropterin synthase n=1 Tax=Balnearium lithotrophicum TaxID=223788 RepID=A0A521APQ3_9BACT|nr:6-carboxytetrahydropterin synthase [Balnearium lithotrophicum]SMO36775.1 6-pyruvoyltetrahydropterin/6-carboxytetrahydropterin synthase [Balnearium lithotrophicum]